MDKMLYSYNRNGVLHTPQKEQSYDYPCAAPLELLPSDMIIVAINIPLLWSCIV